MEVALYQREKNEHGVDVLRTTCPDCKTEFTITPYPENLSDWTRCLAKGCKSYDPSRDVDWMFPDE